MLLTNDRINATMGHDTRIRKKVVKTACCLAFAFLFTMTQEAMASWLIYRSLPHRIADAGGIAVVRVTAIEKLMPPGPPYELTSWRPTHKVRVERQELFFGVVPREFNAKIEISSERNINTRLVVGSNAIVFFHSKRSPQRKVKENELTVTLSDDYFLFVDDLVVHNNKELGQQALDFLRVVTTAKQPQVAPGQGIYRTVGDTYVRACRDGLQSSRHEMRLWILGIAMRGVALDDRTAPLVLSVLENDQSPVMRGVAARLLMVARHKPATIPLAKFAKRLTKTNRQKEFIRDYLISRNIVWRLETMPEDSVQPIMEHIATHHGTERISLRTSNHTGILKVTDRNPQLPGSTIRAINDWLAPLTVPPWDSKIYLSAWNGKLLVDTE